MRVKGLPIDQHFAVDPRDWRELEPDEDDSDDDEDVHCPASVKMMLGLDPDRLFGIARPVQNAAAVEDEEKGSKFVSDEQRQAFFGHYGKGGTGGGDKGKVEGGDKSKGEKPPTQNPPTERTFHDEVLVPGTQKAPEHLATQSLEYLKSIGKEDRNVLRHYSTDAYGDLNKAMRECPPDFKCVEGENKVLMDKMERILQGAPKFKEPVTVYRGMRFDEPEEVAKLISQFKDHQNSAREFSMPCITSTTASGQVAIEGFAHDNQPEEDMSLAVVMSIRAKSGVYVERITRQKGEHEVIQSSRARYRVVGVSHVTYRDRPASDSLSESERIQTIHLEEI